MLSAELCRSHHVQYGSSRPNILCAALTAPHTLPVASSQDSLHMLLHCLATRPVSVQWHVSQSGKLNQRRQSEETPELVGSRLCAPVRESGPRMLPTQLGCQAQPLAAQHAMINCCLHCIQVHVRTRSCMMLSLHWLCLFCCCVS